MKHSYKLLSSLAVVVFALAFLLASVSSEVRDLETTVGSIGAAVIANGDLSDRVSLLEVALADDDASAVVPEGFHLETTCLQTVNTPCKNAVNVTGCYVPVCVARGRIFLHDNCTISPRFNIVKCDGMDIIDLEETKA